MKQLRTSKIVDASTVVATANYGFTADSHRVVSVQAVWTATTASFAVKLQMSNDGSTWSDFTTATTITNADGSVMWSVDYQDALYWRVNSVRTSGTLTTLKAYVANLDR